MKFILIVCLSFTLFSVSAQIGRHDAPADTTAIGGKVQQDMAGQMEAQDQLTNDLISVRDSVHLISSDAITGSRKMELDATIMGLKSSDQSPELMKKGYALLNEIRYELKKTNTNSTNK
jgi:hypothetical protein